MGIKLIECKWMNKWPLELRNNIVHCFSVNISKVGLIGENYEYVLFELKS